MVEICCCRKPELPESCLPRSPDDRQRSSYCGTNPSLRSAEASELNIVCSEWSLAVQPEQVSAEEELVLQIDKITNFPGYEQGTDDDTGANLKGPYAGGDIAVYHITPESKEKAKRRMNDKTLAPACLPQKEYGSKRGIFAGWLDQEPFYRVSTTDIETYEEEYLTLRRVEVEETDCKDPDWMKTNTYYPAATECYRDRSQSSCFVFGNSGSGTLREINVDGDKRYAFTGPLSMSKSCDSIYIFDNQISYSSSNPGIFTDAYCYLPWIAEMYGMNPPKDYVDKASCSTSKGKQSVIHEPSCLGLDSENVNRERCKNWHNYYESEYACQKDLIENGSPGSIPSYEQEVDDRPPTEPKMCDFESHTYSKNGLNIPWDQCMLEAREGYAYNIYMCKVSRV